MLDNEHFYNASIRKMTIAFGAIFSNISVYRFNAKKQPVKQIKVPVYYAPKQKFYQGLDKATHDDKTNIQITWPRIAYEITSLFYDSNRMLSPINKIKLKNDRVDYQPVPYNVTYSLYIGAKNTEDALQIVEQIVPFFKPYFTVSINELCDEESRDIPITLQSIDFSDSYDSEVGQDRTIFWTMNFQANGFIRGPSDEEIKIKTILIETAIANELVNKTTIEVDPYLASETDDYDVVISHEDIAPE